MESIYGNQGMGTMGGQMTLSGGAAINLALGGKGDDEDDDDDEDGDESKKGKISVGKAPVKLGAFDDSGMVPEVRASGPKGAHKPHQAGVATRATITTGKDAAVGNRPLAAAVHAQLKEATNGELSKKIAATKQVGTARVKLMRRASKRANMQFAQGTQNMQSLMARPEGSSVSVGELTGALFPILAGLGSRVDALANVQIRQSREHSHNFAKLMRATAFVKVIPAMQRQLAAVTRAGDDMWSVGIANAVWRKTQPEKQFVEWNPKSLVVWFGRSKISLPVFVGGLAALSYVNFTPAYPTGMDIADRLKFGLFGGTPAMTFPDTLRGRGGWLEFRVLNSKQTDLDEYIKTTGVTSSVFLLSWDTIVTQATKLTVTVSSVGADDLGPAARVNSAGDAATLIIDLPVNVAKGRSLFACVRELFNRLGGTTITDTEIRASDAYGQLFQPTEIRANLPLDGIFQGKLTESLLNARSGWVKALGAISGAMPALIDANDYGSVFNTMITLLKRKDPALPAVGSYRDDGTPVPLRDLVPAVF